MELEGEQAVVRDIALKVSADFILSRELREDEVEKVAEYAVLNFPKVFSRGAAKGEEPRIVELTVNSKKISIAIESGRRVRAHEAIKRARKAFSEGLGPKIGLGIRGINVKSFEVAFMGEGLKKCRLPFVEKVEEVENGLKYWLKVDESGLYSQVPDRIISLFLEKQKARAMAREVHKEIWRSPKKNVKYALDPGPILEEEGWVKRFHPGIWYYLQPYTHLLRILESMIIEKVAKPLGFQEVVLPKLIPLEVARKKGHLSGIPSEMLYVCEPSSREPSCFEDYADLVKVLREPKPEVLRGFLKEPSFTLPYAQCEPFYELFAGETVNLDNPPVKLYDRSGFSFRYEVGGLRSLERLMAFTRIEMVYLGNPDDVAEIRDGLIENYLSLLDKTLDMEVRSAEVTPVWMAHAGVAEDVSRNVAATFDIEAYLPFRGDRENGWLEIANASVHYDKYVEWFGIKERRGREVWTGCSGNGLERWAYAFLARHGFDVGDWPVEVKRLWTPLKPVVMDTWPPRASRKPPESS